MKFPSRNLTTVTTTYVGGDAGDTVTSYIEDEEGSCTDNLSITQETEEEDLFCVDLELDPDSYTLDVGDSEAEEIESTVTVEGSDSDWTGTLIVEADGDGELFYSNGDAAESNGTLEIAVSGTSTTVTFTYEGGVEGDTIRPTWRAMKTFAQTPTLLNKKRKKCVRRFIR